MAFLFSFSARMFLRTYTGTRCYYTTRTPLIRIQQSLIRASLPLKIVYPLCMHTIRLMLAQDYGAVYARTTRVCIDESDVEILTRTSLRRYIVIVLLSSIQTFVPTCFVFPRRRDTRIDD